jgi:amidase
MSNVLEMSAYDIAKAIRERKVRSVHAVSSFIEQIKKFNSKIHAVVNINEQAALLRAHQADDDLSRGVNWGPLHGVPITVKDAWKTKDVKTTCK